MVTGNWPSEPSSRWQHLGHLHLNLHLLRNKSHCIKYHRSFTASWRSELQSGTRNESAEVSCTVSALGNHQMCAHRQLMQQSSPAWSYFYYWAAPRSCSSFSISFGPSVAWGTTLICSTEALRSVTITRNCLIRDAAERQRCIIAKFCGLAT